MPAIRRWRLMTRALLFTAALLPCLGAAAPMAAVGNAAAASAAPGVGSGALALPALPALQQAPPTAAAHDWFGHSVAGWPLGAVMKLGTVGWTRTSSYDGWNWAKPDLLDYYADGAGSLAIVTCDPTAGALAIDTFDPSTLQRIGDTRSISLAGWPDWGGFYAGPDGFFYVLVGRENPDENDTLDVVAVRRYDRDWTLVGTAYVQGGAPMGIYTPLAFSAPHMVLVGNRLVVHMGRLIYAHEGVHHQVNLTFEVDVDTMTATTFDRFGGWPYSSHSFQQLVAMSDSGLVTIDHGDAYPRAIQMGVIADYPSKRQVSTYDLFAFNGAVGDNFTGATVTGLVSGTSGIVVVGSSIRHPDAPNGALGPADEHRNIYAIWADPATGAHAVRWLTDFAPQGADEALEPRVVQVGPDRFAVLFSVRGDSGYRMEYRLIDSAGAVLASASFPGAFFCAASDPILIGGKAYWAGIAPDSWPPPVPAYLFGIDVSDPAAPFLFTVIPAPTVSGFLPASGPVGTSVTITGADLADATAVSFNGAAATSFTVVSGAQITATVPEGAATGPITVTTPGGTGTSATSFTVIPAPAITSFTPASGPVGTSVTIVGTDLTGATAVAFSGAAATSFTVVSDTLITATVPAGATSGTITVTTPGGTGASATSFTVTPSAPLVSKVTLKLSGLTVGAVKLGGIVTASGAVTPLSLAGSRVTLTVQIRTGLTWVKVKTSSASSRPVGNYRWKYTPAVKGAYRMRAQVAASAAYRAAATPWRAFTVK